MKQTINKTRGVEYCLIMFCSLIAILSFFPFSTKFNFWNLRMISISEEKLYHAIHKEQNILLIPMKKKLMAEIRLV